MGRLLLLVTVTLIALHQPALADDGAIQVTARPDPDYLPAWSPDGGQIAFTSYRSGNGDIWEICVGGPSAVEASTWGAIKAMSR